MKHFFSSLLVQRQRRQALLTLGLLGGLASPALAQIPSTIYVLGKQIGTSNPVILEVNPANLATTSNTDLFTAGSFRAVTGLLSANQPLLAIDVRPSTGQIYALGYNATTQQAQLYILNPSTNALTAVGGNISLNLQDTNNGAGGGATGNTLGQTVNIGFDFNPRLDRIRVVAPNGTNYVLNPNNGTLQATNTPLRYTAPAYVGRTPYIGAAGYTNSQLGLSGTALYDLDIANTNGLIARQNTPNDGTLDLAGPLRFALRQSGGAYNYGPTGVGFPLASPTYRLDLDVAYDRTNATNRFYVLEAAYRAAGGASVNLYELTQSDVTNSTTNNANAIALGENITGSGTFAFYDIAAFMGAPKTWTGQVSTNWADGGNWFPTGTPGTADDVLIPGNGFFVSAANFTVAQQPTVSGTQNAGSITLSDGAVLTLANNSVLNNYGNFANNGSAVAGDASAANGGTGKLVLASTSGTPQEISGSALTTFPNLQVLSAGATTASPVAIRRSLEVSGTLAIGSGQAFTLLSSASGTAYVINNAGSTVSGIATVQRYITPSNAGQGYRHYSSPVSKASGSSTSNTVADLATSSFTPVVNSAYNSATAPAQVRPYPTVYGYDQSRLASSNASYAVGDFDNGFFSPTALADTLAPGRGYTVNIAGTELVDFQGKLRSGNYSSGTLARGAQTSAGYHLLGNPYPSAISYTSVYGASGGTSSGIQDGLYVYRSSGQYTGSYSTYLSNGQSVNGGSDNIPLAQGFFVRAQVGGGQVNFTNAARTGAPETATFQRTANTAPALALTLSGNNAANQTRIYFDKDATSGYDNARDGFYLPASHGLDLASDASPEALSINGLPELTGATSTVPLRLHTAAAGTYSLAVDELANLPAGYRAYLRDANTGTYTELATAASLSLTLAPTDPATGRYAVVFSTSKPLATASATLSALAAVYPSPTHGTATLVLPLALRGSSASTVQLLNALGQVVLTKTMAAGAAPTLELPLTGLAAGIYTVRATTEAGLVAKRLVVQ